MGDFQTKGTAQPKVQRHVKTSSAQGGKGGCVLGNDGRGGWRGRENIEGAQAEVV